MGFILSRPKFDPSLLVGAFKGELQKKYDVVQALGVGRHGQVYRVRDKVSGVEYCAKKMHAQDARSQADVKEEFEKMRTFMHPNCCKVVELVQSREIMDGVWKSSNYLICDLARGSDLHGYIHGAATVGYDLHTEDWAAGVLKQLMQALAYMHGMDYVHNDVKPENVLVMTAFKPAEPFQVPWTVLADFGCASTIETAGTHFGDTRYQSPEKWRVLGPAFSGKEADEDLLAQVDAKADVWAAGVSLFELLTGGVIPFIYQEVSLSDVLETPGGWKTIRRSVKEEELDVRSHYRDASNELVDILQCMLSKNCELRPSAVGALEHEWFDRAPLAKIAERRAKSLRMYPSKGIVHRILVNAFAAKVQREHYWDCWEAFQTFDTDRDGHISVDEFRESKASLLRKTTMLPESKVSHMAQSNKDSIDAAELKAFSSIDVDGNQKLNFTEFVAATFDWSSLEQSVMSHGLKALFDQMDSDGDGFIRQKDFFRLFQGSVPRQQLRTTFQQMAGDDKLLSYKELKAYLFDPVEEGKPPSFRRRKSAPTTCCTAPCFC